MSLFHILSSLWVLLFIYIYIYIYIYIFFFFFFFFFCTQKRVTWSSSDMGKTENVYVVCPLGHSPISSYLCWCSVSTEETWNVVVSAACPLGQPQIYSPLYCVHWANHRYTHVIVMYALGLPQAYWHLYVSTGPSLNVLLCSSSSHWH